MLIIAFRTLALAGLIFSLSVFAVRTVKVLKTDDGKEDFKASKKCIPADAALAVVSGFMYASGAGAHPYNATGFKLFKLVDEHNTLGTMNLGLSVPACVAAFILLPKANIGTVTLIALVAAACAGGFIGARFVTKINVFGVRLMLALGSIILGIFALIRIFLIKDVGSDTAINLEGFKLIIGILCSFIIGILMNVGTAYTIPAVVVYTLLGLNVSASIGIALASVALLTSFCNGPQFIKAEKFDIVACICQFVCGSLGAIISCYLITSHSFDLIFAIITAVFAFFAAFLYLKDFLKSSKTRKQITGESEN